MPLIEVPAARSVVRLCVARTIACCALAMLSAACSGNSPAAAPASNGGDDVRNDLRLLQTTRILFGHQSVGANLLNGVRQVSLEQGEALDLVEITPDSGASSGGLAHFLVGENGSPASKLAMFPWVLRGFSSTPFDLAILKFCYVDFSARTDVRRVFTAYQEMVRSLRRHHPQTTLVHATAPLRADDGTRGRINAWLGRWDTRGDNDKRNEFNALLRSEYSSSPMFDLAAIESTAYDGRRSTYPCGRGTCEALAPEYTTDGGHLNARGSRVAASALIRALASARRQQLAAPRTAAPLDD
jgi:hypothetical protein